MASTTHRPAYGSDNPVGISGASHFPARCFSKESHLPPHPDPLPRGEGATTVSFGRIDASSSSLRREAFLPLPEGEGRGERERHTRIRRLQAIEMCSGIIGRYKSCSFRPPVVLETRSNA